MKLTSVILVKLITILILFMTSCNHKQVRDYKIDFIEVNAMPLSLATRFGIEEDSVIDIEKHGWSDYRNIIIKSAPKLTQIERILLDLSKTEGKKPYDIRVVAEIHYQSGQYELLVIDGHGAMKLGDQPINKNFYLLDLILPLEYIEDDYYQYVKSVWEESLK